MRPTNPTFHETSAASLRAAATIAAALSLLVAAVIVSHLGGARTVLWVDDGATILAALAATVACLLAGRRCEGRMRRFWLLLAAAGAAFTLGEAIWGAYDLVLLRPPGSASWADVAYLASIPLIAAGLLSHPVMRRGTARARSLLDGLLVACALLFFAWQAVLGPLWHATDMSTLGGLVTLAYPVSDVVIVFLVVGVIRRLTGPPQTSLWLLLAGLLAMAGSDMTYAYLTQAGDYAAGELVDVGWIVAYLAIALSALSAQRGDSALPEQDGTPTTSAVVVPLLLVLGALAVTAVELQLGVPLDRIAVGIACALVGLALARHALLCVEVRRGARGVAVCDRVVDALGAPAPTQGAQR